MLSAFDLNVAGAKLFFAGDLDGAKLHYEAALNVDPEFVPALANLGYAAVEQHNLAASVAFYRRAVALAPLDGSMWSNLGSSLMQLELFEESNVALQRALELSPDSIAVLHNVALFALRNGSYDVAIEFLNRVDRLSPGRPQIASDRAHAMLGAGVDMPSAWREYEWRWHDLTHLPPWDFHIPEWHGEELHGKRILFHAEQGFGDTIMCARFVRDLRALGAEVVFAVQRALIPLFSAQEWEGVEVIDVMEVDSGEGFDFHSPLFSAMRWLGITRESIDPTPYLLPLLPPEVPSRGWGRFANSDASIRRVGIVWASGNRNAPSNWRRRVSKLESWLTLAELPNVELHSLYPEGASEIDALGVGGLIKHCPPTPDFLATAKYIMGLDAVICVDTAIGHLSAALGKPTWLLSPYSRCWRWWNADEGSGLPWYDSMVVLRQEVPKDWDSLLQKCRERLECDARETSFRDAA